MKTEVAITKYSRHPLSWCAETEDATLTVTTQDELADWLVRLELDGQVLGYVAMEDLARLGAFWQARMRR